MRIPITLSLDSVLRTAIDETMELNESSVSLANGNEHTNQHISVDVNIAIFPVQLAVDCLRRRRGALNTKIICHRSFYTLFYSNSFLRLKTEAIFQSECLQCINHMQKQETRHRDKNSILFITNSMGKPFSSFRSAQFSHMRHATANSSERQFWNK